MSGHTCHAHGCSTAVPPRLFMCRVHWFRLPKILRDAIWREYRPGQEVDKDPSLRYLAVSNRAIGELAFRPHERDAARDSAPYLLRAEVYRQKALEAGDGDPLPWVPVVRALAERLP